MWEGYRVIRRTGEWKVYRFRTLEELLRFRSRQMAKRARIRPILEARYQIQKAWWCVGTLVVYAVVMGVLATMGK